MNEVDDPVLYTGQHEFKTNNNIITFKTLTIYKPKHNQELMMEVTDSNEPFILYCMKISRLDFLEIKESQGLTTDFSLFPNQLITLLKQTKDKNTRIYINIEEDKKIIVLSIREECTVKHVTHIKLEFQQGTEKEIKEKVMRHISGLHKSLQSSEKNCKEMTELVSSLQENLQIKEQEWYKLRDNCKKHKEELESRMDSETAALKLSKQQLAEDLTKEFSLKLKLLEEEKKNENEKLKESVQSMILERDTTKKEKEILERRLAETTDNLEATQTEYIKVEKDLNTVRIRLKMVVDDNNKKIDVLNKQVEKMEKIIQDKKISLAYLKSELDGALKENKLLREKYSQTSDNLHTVQSQLIKLDKEFHQNVQDVKKSNEIIIRLQKELSQEKIHKTQLKEQLVDSQVSNKSLSEDCKRIRKKLVEYEKQLEQYKNISKARGEEVLSLKIDKNNLQKALGSVFKELSEIKQGTLAQERNPFSFGNDSQKKETYYYKKFLEESTNKPNSLPLPPLLEETSKSLTPTSEHQPLIMNSTDSIGNVAIGTVPVSVQKGGLQEETSSLLKKGDIKGSEDRPEKHINGAVIKKTRESSSLKEKSVPSRRGRSPSTYTWPAQRKS